MSEFHIKKITLPSGKVVEIIYLRDSAAAVAGEVGGEPADADAGGDLVIRRIELCQSCGGDRVHPLEWHEIADMRWELHLRCPDCRWSGSGVYEQPEVERYDDILNGGADRLIEELDRVTRENMTEWLERFGSALANDLIVPEDF
jgi:hypothetical protein